MEPSCHQAACTMYAAWWCFLTFFCDLLYFLICISHQDAFTMCAAWWWIYLTFFCDLLYFELRILYLSSGCLQDVCGLVVDFWKIFFWVRWSLYFVFLNWMFARCVVGPGFKKLVVAFVIVFGTCMSNEWAPIMNNPIIILFIMLMVMMMIITSYHRQG